MPWFFDRAGTDRFSPLRTVRVLPSARHYGVGSPEFILISRLNSPACVFPCQRFKCDLTAALA